MSHPEKSKKPLPELNIPSVPRNDVPSVDAMLLTAAHVLPGIYELLGEIRDELAGINESIFRKADAEGLYPEEEQPESEG